MIYHISASVILLGQCILNTIFQISVFVMLLDRSFSNCIRSAYDQYLLFIKRILPQGYNTCSMLNLTEHNISSAHIRYFLLSNS